VSINFTDVSVTHRLQEALERVNTELESAYEQLQSANEEMETTNEELQSTVEELETTNEELQSTNEELETMNEELQSTNEELQEINDIARAYTRELDSANHFLESIFTGLGHRVIVVDRAMSVLLWNRGAEELWGVRADEAINSALTQLDIGLPIDEIRKDISAILAEESSLVDREISATNRRGKKVDLRIRMAPLISRDDSGVGGVIILTDDRDGAD
jgi:two-component system CheB/CheR fusion protein